MKIGVLTASASRKGGGLFTAAQNLSRELAAKGAAIEVFAGADEYSEADRPAWGNIPVHTRKVVGPPQFAFQLGLLTALRSARPEIVHLHGLWTYQSLAALLSSFKSCGRIISPHGMLDSWALRNSAWKKRLIAALYEAQNLRGANCVHALCEAELVAVRSYGLRGPVAVIPNGVELPSEQFLEERPRWFSQIPKDACVLLFLGRIHPKKGLANLLAAFSKIPGTEKNQWHIAIAGMTEQGHEAELKQLACHLGITSKIHFVGPQFGREKAKTFAAADAFVLPSFSEGLPMAVLEAWSFKLPVLMTPQCNLDVGFANGAALRAEPTVHSLATTLEEFFRMTSAERVAMGNAARKLVQQKCSWRTVADDMLSVFSWAVGSGPKPSCVDEV
jgi:poly(glycerol-phosphate) alpha-glucosyltransferase